jgi:hypothetical protein
MTKTTRTSVAALAGMLCALPFAPAASAADDVQVFPFPQTVRYTHHNDDYTVRVRIPGGVWQDLYEYNVKVDLDSPQKNASMVYFNFEGRVEVSVQKNNGTFAKVAIRPTSREIRHRIVDGTVMFSLDRPENLSIEFDDDRHHNLHLFTQPIRRDLPVQRVAEMSSYDIGKADIPDLDQPVVYFRPGVYKGDIRLKSNTTVYIDGSAIIQSPLIIENVENVRVLSDGLFDDGGQTIIRNASNVTIDGTIHINQAHGTMACFSSRDIHETRIRTIGGGQWSDGLGHFACENVTISDAFIRTSDDNITVYNHRWDTWGNSRDILVKDSTLWADVAHNVMIGIHGNTPSAAHPELEVIERAVFRNIDVLDHDEDEPDYQGTIGLMVGDDNLVRDIRFENWRVERIEDGKLFSLQVLYNAKYNTSPGRGIENITLKDIAFSGKGAPTASLIKGYSSGRGVRHVVLDNVTIGGKKVTKAEPNILDIGDHVEGLVFK